jgi:hypothetical protein
VSATVKPEVKKPVAWYWWPYWMTLLAAALIVFYVVLTPIWMGIRLVAWLSERGRS